MNENQKVQYLIVDTSGFIKNAALQDIGVNIITEQDVINEVTSKRQLRRLAVLPYDLIVQTAHAENIKFVTEFAKRTGDYTSLSATDIKVIALTYQLEKEKLGTDHLKTVPPVSKTVDYHAQEATDLHTPLAGFYMPEKQKKEDLSSKFSKLTCELSEHEVNTILPRCFGPSDDEQGSTKYDEYENDEDGHEDENENKNEDVDKDEHENEHEDEHEDGHEDEHEDENEDENEDEDEDDDDDSGWITPKNISIVKKEIDSELLEEKPATVACLTMDFAMQNVLKQIGLNVVALDGRVIKQMKTFIFRCYACYKTTSIMTKVFCPSCGNKTLKKVAITLDGEGNQQIHINFRKPISKKGKRFSLPMPKGGKHANNPILCEDQPLPDQRQTRLARTKNDPLQDDYIAGYSPFIMRDVYSKSAMLGIRSGGSFKYWMKKNPNETRRRRK